MVLGRIPMERRVAQDSLETAYLWFVQTEVNQATEASASPVISYDRCKRIPWSTVSNAAVMSRKANTAWLSASESSALMRSEYTFVSAVSVENPRLYADW